MSSTDVVVIGAGYAGISAARSLHRAGLDVAVLEAADRIGGRVHTVDVGGTAIDLGGMWLGAGHDRFAALAADAGAATFPTPDHGDALYVDGSRRRRYAAGGTPPIGPLATAVLASVLWRIDRIARTVDLEVPSRTPDAARLDGITVAGWLRWAAPHPAARRLVEIVVSEAVCADPGSISMLAVATYLRSSGGIAALVGATGGAQQDLLLDGASGPLRHAARELDGRIVLDAPVRCIEHSGDGVTVHTAGDTVHGRRVVVALPPVLAGRIEYRPGMPAERDALTQRMPMGSIWKIFAVYERPFWRDAGLSGETLDVRSPVSATFDVSPPGGPGLMCTLVGGAAAIHLDGLTTERRRTLVLDHFTSLFGEGARRPDDYLEVSWAADPFVRGGYSGYAAPGALSSVGDWIRRPVGRIHWAGTETATEYQGYIEGAIRSGERAAAEVVAALDTRVATHG